MAHPNTSSHRCTTCDRPITKRDIALNSNDALELTGGYGCERCLADAASFATEFFARNQATHLVVAIAGCHCPHCEVYQ